MLRHFGLYQRRESLLDRLADELVVICLQNTVGRRVRASKDQPSILLKAVHVDAHRRIFQQGVHARVLPLQDRKSVV